MAIARQIKIVVDKVHERYENLGGDGDTLPETLVEPLQELERYCRTTYARHNVESNLIQVLT